MLRKYHLSGYELMETPKEARYFENVRTYSARFQPKWRSRPCWPRRGRCNSTPSSSRTASNDPVAGVAGKFTAAARRAKSPRSFWLAASRR